MAHVIIRFEDDDLPDVYVGGPTKNFVLDRYREGSDDCSYPTPPADPRANEPAAPTHYLGNTPEEVMLTLGIAIQQGTPVTMAYARSDNECEGEDVTVTPVRLLDNGTLLRAYLDSNPYDSHLYVTKRILRAITELHHD